MVIENIKKIRRLVLGFIRYRRLRIKNKNFKSGKNFYCGYNCFISTKNKITIGNNFYMGNYCHLSANAIIGNDVLFASFVSLVGGDHKIDYIEGAIRSSGRDDFKTITIKDNVWIGHGVIILQGVTIESGAVLAAGSVVTKNIGQNEIWGGNPARFIRKRKFIKNETNYPRP